MSVYIVTLEGAVRVTKGGNVLEVTRGQNTVLRVKAANKSAAIKLGAIYGNVLGARKE